MLIQGINTSQVFLSEGPSALLPFLHSLLQVVNRCHSGLNIRIDRGQKLIPEEGQQATAHTRHKQRLVVPLELGNIFKIESH